METAAYGMVTSIPQPGPVVAAAPGAATEPAAGMWGLPVYVNRWESAAMGAVAIIALALLANAAYDA